MVGGCSLGTVKARMEKPTNALQPIKLQWRAHQQSFLGRCSESYLYRKNSASAISSGAPYIRCESHP